MLRQIRSWLPFNICYRPRTPRLRSNLSTSAYLRRGFASLALARKPPTNHPIPSMMPTNNFDLVTRIKLDFTDVEVSKWRSKVTGLTVVHIDYEGPIVDGYFAVATEIFNDSGCPHTLEHLVFMGSEKYPYKGIIDHFANRGFSNGTNAWTATDSTVYTASTAGDQGFLQLLPIYVDHILYPTITDAAFLTEVHHVDSKGEDSGVVYSEMQGRQNTSGDLMFLELQRMLNPQGSGYRSETGGLMEALRILNADQIRKYHASYYVPHNLVLIVAGKLTSGTDGLLRVVQEQVEPSLIEHKQNQGPRPAGWKRPFIETPSADRKPIEKQREAEVEFPEKDESMGEIVIGFTGPPPDKFLERQAIEILGTYLTSSATAPLNKEFIETEHPLCSYISFSEESRATIVDMGVYVGSVPTEHLDDFTPKLRNALRRIADQGIDMERMRLVISRDKRQLRSQLESSKGETFTEPILFDYLLGPQDGSKLKEAMDDMSNYDILRSWTSDQWSALLRKYYVDPHCIIVKGKPSAALARKLEADEKARIAAQVKKLGPEGLAKLGKQLDEAKAEHDKPIPEEVLKKFPVPSVDSISWISVQSHQEGLSGTPNTLVTTDNHVLKRYIEADGKPLPFFVEFDHVQSDFVTVHAYLSLDTVPNHLRPLSTAYLSAFFSLPIHLSSGKRLTHEEVVNRLDDETVSYDTGLGVVSYFSELFRVSIKVETQSYAVAVQWLKDLLYRSEFDKERLLVVLAKIQQSMAEMKRDAPAVMGSVGGGLLFDESSTSRANGITVQMDYIPEVIKRLQEDPESVIADFETIRKHLTDPAGMRFSVAGNILDLKKPRSTWLDCFGDKPDVTLRPVPLVNKTLSEIGKNPVKKAIVVSMASIESSYTMHTTKGPQGFNNPDYPARRVAREVLNATESFLWRYIRGSGLAYGASVSSDDEAGFTTFSLYRSSNAMQAYREAGRVVKGLVNRSIPLEDTVLDAAKSSIVYAVTKGVATPGRAALISFVNQALKNVSQDDNLDLLQKIQAVTKEDVLKALEEGFLPLFDSNTSVAVVVTAPGKAEAIEKDLTELGFDVDSRSINAEQLGVDHDDMEVDEEGSDSGSESGSEESDLRRT